MMTAFVGACHTASIAVLLAVSVCSASLFSFFEEILSHTNAGYRPNDVSNKIIGTPRNSLRPWHESKQMVRLCSVGNLS